MPTAPVNPAAPSTVAVAAAVTVWSPSVPIVVGAEGFTVTSMVWVALPTVLVAVTVTVAVPAATPVSVTTEPLADTVNTAVLLLVAL